jgi:hypothetical protein
MGMSTPDDERDIGEDTAEMPAISDDDDDLMTRFEVAMKFRVTSAAVAAWTRRKRPLLTEVRTADNKPRYRRREVDSLFAAVFPQGECA